MTDLSLALWATNVAPRLNGLPAWLARIEGKLIEARRAGADLLVMPEYACVQWLSFAPKGIGLAQEIGWMAGLGAEAVEGLKPLVARHEVALLAGTMPVAHDGAFRNRAYLLTPEGKTFIQDKLCLTPQEKTPEGWCLEPGETIRVARWRGLRLVVAVCLDIELPALAAVLSGLDLDLVLVPSMTDALSGYHRVFDCAKARAIELQAIVCPVGTIGETAYRSLIEPNVSGAAVYLPCETALGMSGVLDALPPRDGDAGEGPVLTARGLPVERVRELRRGGAHVWPGAWRADQLGIEAVD